jgi:hypothetical protein
VDAGGYSSASRAEAGKDLSLVVGLREDQQEHYSPKGGGVLTGAVDWSEVTAIATWVLAVGLLGSFGAAAFAAQQVREARKSREAQIAAEFFRRWNDDALVEARRMVGGFKSADDLRDAYVEYVAANAPEAYILYRELDYFEQLAALESRGAFDLELIRMLLGQILIERWKMWRPAILQAHGPGSYPLFEGLVEKLRGEDAGVRPG